MFCANSAGGKPPRLKCGRIVLTASQILVDASAVQFLSQFRKDKELETPRQMLNRFAVIDLETTGFGRSDAVLEIGIVLMDGNEIVQEWETLINPNRDIANDDIHALTPSILSTAPMFSEVANDIAKLLQNRILVAHNLPFDQRMLAQEFSRINMMYSLGQGICTLKATGLKLEAACEKFGIKNQSAHRAITDARAASLVFMATFSTSSNSLPCSFTYAELEATGRTLARGAFLDDDRHTSSSIRRIARIAEIPISSDAEMSYLDALSSGLSDLHLSDMEIAALEEWAAFLGINEKQRQSAHKKYFDSFVHAAERDGIVTIDERRLIDKLALLLDLHYESDLPIYKSDAFS
jgi:DNA polymerase-3 subunit epsilon